MVWLGSARKPEETHKGEEEAGRHQTVTSRFERRGGRVGAATVLE